VLRRRPLVRLAIATGVSIEFAVWPSADISEIGQQHPELFDDHLHLLQQCRNAGTAPHRIDKRDSPWPS